MTRAYNLGGSHTPSSLYLDRYLPSSRRFYSCYIHLTNGTVGLLQQMKFPFDHPVGRGTVLTVVLVALGFFILKILSNRFLPATSCTAPGTTRWGKLADEVYHLGPTEPSVYYESLHNFTRAFPSSSLLKGHLLRSVSSHSLHPNSSLSFPSMVDNRFIFQTDKEPIESEATQSWKLRNPEWKYQFLDDSTADVWVEEWFNGTDVLRAWLSMEAGVIKADFLRYLLMIVHGGVYSDTDTVALRPIEQWGKLQPSLYTNGSLNSFEYDPSSEPSLILGIEVDVWKPGCNWIKKWPRPLQIVQWTLSSVPYHPIYLDTARRITLTARQIEEWAQSRDEEVKLLEGLNDAASSQKARELRNLRWTSIVSTLEWTGPAMFTDAVLAYIQTQYNVTWPSLQSLNAPLRIGEILILPLAGFSPNADSDLRWSPPSSPQSSVLHLFRGSWKSIGKWKAFKRWLATRNESILTLGIIIILVMTFVWFLLRKAKRKRAITSGYESARRTERYELVWDARDDGHQED